jgi:hypothetical protein
LSRNRLIIAGSILLGVVLIGIIALVGIFRFLSNRKASNPRSHLVPLGYCNASDIKPCIVSFSVDADSQMLVNILIPAGYADFYLTIRSDSTENKYECEKLQDFPNNVTCTGPQMYPGPQLHFALISTLTGQTFAQGDFAIIGLMLPSPVAEATEPPAATEVPTEAAVLLETPTALSFDLRTPSPTLRPTASSYPNPSYYP